MRRQQIGDVSELAVGHQGGEGHIPEGGEDVDGIAAAGQEQVELLLHVGEVDGDQVDLTAALLAEDFVHLFLDVGLVGRGEHLGVGELDHGIGLGFGLGGDRGEAKHHDGDQQQSKDAFHLVSPF